MRGTVFSRLRLGATKLLRDQRGNAFMLTAAAIVPVIGIVGSAVDIGRAYMTQLRLQQACDSGVLAGRRAMASGTYTDAAKAEASKMFNFNFPEQNYGSTGISFSSQAPNASDVVGSASAVLPTALMYMFGKDEFRLSAACTAKLEISNIRHLECGQQHQLQSDAVRYSNAAGGHHADFAGAAFAEPDRAIC